MISASTGKAECKQTERADEKEPSILLIVFGSRDCCHKITALSRILVKPLALSVNNLNVSLRKDQVDYLGKSWSQTNNLRWQNWKISWSLFNKKSALDCDKSHLCACMIPYWYFESPVALVWPGLPLALDAPDPLYFSFNHSGISIPQDYKEIIPVSCADNEMAPRWSLLITYPSKGIKCHREITKNTRETEGEWELGPVPTLSCVQDGGLVDTSSQCKASFGYCICNKSFLSYYPALVNLHFFWTYGFIYSALKDSEIKGHIDTATNCSSHAKTYKLIYVCFVAIVQISIN